MNDILFSKIREDAIIPTKNDKTFFVYPNFKMSQMYFAPHETRSVQIGIASSFPIDCKVILKGIDEINAKGIKLETYNIDHNFKDEWVLTITNTNDKPALITKEKDRDSLRKLSNDYIILLYEDAIAQATIVSETQKIEIKEVPYDELNGIKSRRRIGRTE